MVRDVVRIDKSQILKDMCTVMRCLHLTEVLWEAIGKFSVMECLDLLLFKELTLVIWWIDVEVGKLFKLLKYSVMQTTIKNAEWL